MFWRVVPFYRGRFHPLPLVPGRKVSTWKPAVRVKFKNEFEPKSDPKINGFISLLVSEKITILTEYLLDSSLSAEVDESLLDTVCVLVTWTGARGIHQLTEKAFSVGPHSDKQSFPLDYHTWTYTHRLTSFMYMQHIYTQEFMQIKVMAIYMHAPRHTRVNTHTKIIQDVSSLIHF